MQQQHSPVRVLQRSGAPPPPPIWMAVAWHAGSEQCLYQLVYPRLVPREAPRPTRSLLPKDVIRFDMAPARDMAPSARAPAARAPPALPAPARDMAPSARPTFLPDNDPLAALRSEIAAGTFVPSSAAQALLRSPFPWALLFPPPPLPIAV